MESIDKLKLENKILWDIIRRISYNAPLADSTCRYPGATLFAAARNEVEDLLAKEGFKL